MKAFILAGGEGTRLRPYTYNMPKPMMKLGGKPILQFVIENLRRCGIKEIVLTVGYRHETIQSYFGEGKDFGVKIKYSVENEKLNTAGSIHAFKGEVDESFVVVMGDHLTNLDLRDMLKEHKKANAIATVALYQVKQPLEFGVADVEGESIVGFREKPLLTHNYNTAIYIFEPRIFDYINEKEDFAKDVIPRLIEKGEKVHAYIFNDVWFDIGRIGDYEKLVKLFKVLKLVNDLS